MSKPIRPIKPIKPIKPVRPPENEVESIGKATAFKNSIQNKFKTFENNDGLSHRKENIELIFLLLVLGFLAITFVRADFIGKVETQRYGLEQSANTDNLSHNDIGGLLNQSCPELSKQGFYRSSSDNYGKYATGCPTLNTPSTQTKAYQVAIAKLETINQKMIEFEASIDNGETTVLAEAKNVSPESSDNDNLSNDHLINDNLTSDKLENRQQQRRDWYQKQGYQLNIDGSIDNLADIVAEIKQHQENPTIETAMAALALADGNRIFPYTKVFSDSLPLQKSYNKLARNLQFIRSTNLNNFNDKPALSKQLLTPVYFLPIAWWQFSAWALLAWFSLALTRRIHKPYAFIPILLGLWLTTAHFSPSISLTNTQIIITITLSAIISILTYLPYQPTRDLLLNEQHQWQLGSRFALPGFALFVGVGLLIMLDLGGRGYLASRAEAVRLLPLKHMRIIFWCFFFLSIVPSINYLLGNTLSKVFNSQVQILFEKSAEKSEKFKAIAIFSGITLVVAIVVIALRNKPYIIAEILKVWLVFGLALYVVSRGEESNDPSFLFSEKAIPLYVIMLIPTLLLIITTEMGTLQVFIYAIAVFLGGFFAHVYKTHSKLKSRLLGAGFTLSIMILFTACVAVFGDYVASRAGERVDMWIDPFNSINDQMAIIHWFRESTPFFGYGFGNVPWCGFNLGSCDGVPHQQQSDYTATSLLAVYGKFYSVLLLAVFCGWIGRMLKAQAKIHGHITGSKGYPVNFSHSVLAWAGICWAVVALVQTFVTLFGNLGVLPLTGVTLPFLSYGDSALLTNTVLMALIINLPKKDGYIDKNHIKIAE